MHTSGLFKYKIGAAIFLEDANMFKLKKGKTEHINI